MIKLCHKVIPWWSNSVISKCTFKNSSDLYKPLFKSNRQNQSSKWVGACVRGWEGWWVRPCVRAYVCEWVRARAYVYACVRVRVRVWCGLVCCCGVCVCVCVCACVRACVRARARAHTHTHTHTRGHTCNLGSQELSIEYCQVCKRRSLR